MNERTNGAIDIPHLVNERTNGDFILKGERTNERSCFHYSGNDWMGMGVRKKSFIGKMPKRGRLTASSSINLSLLCKKDRMPDQTFWPAVFILVYMILIPISIPFH